jgi:UDPglucose 6-dehydrogenase
MGETMIKTIGIIGQGFVGTAIYEGLKQVYNLMTYDKKDGGHFNVHGMLPNAAEHSDNPLREVVLRCDGPIFLCLPTPMNPDGSCNTDIVEKVVCDIDAFDLPRILVIKSTVIPGTTDRINRMCKNVTVCFNPEFLTERSAVDDFKNQKFIIIGGPSDATKEVKHVYQRGFPNVPCYRTEALVAEMMKYTENCYLASRVAFANEIKQICDAINVDYDKVVEYATKDERIGHTHWAVPGPDGHFGFGGSCFVKDLNAMMKLAQDHGVDPKVMRGVWEKNLEVRPERDWEQLKGRAVI